MPVRVTGYYVWSVLQPRAELQKIPRYQGKHSPLTCDEVMWQSWWYVHVQGPPSIQEDSQPALPVQTAKESHRYPLKSSSIAQVGSSSMDTLPYSS